MPKDLQKIGEVVHYFSDIEVAVVKSTENKLSVGDKVKINGATTDFEQTVDSLQIDKKDVSEIDKGEEAGMKVEERVREGDEVYRLE